MAANVRVVEQLVQVRLLTSSNNCFRLINSVKSRLYRV